MSIAAYATQNFGIRGCCRQRLCLVASPDHPLGRSVDLVKGWHRGARDDRTRRDGVGDPLETTFLLRASTYTTTRWAG